MYWPSSRVWTSVIVQKDNSGTNYPVPLLLNGPSEFLQYFAVTLSIHRLTSGQEVHEENSPSARTPCTSLSAPTKSARISSCREIHCDANSSCYSVYWVMCVTHVSSPVIIRMNGSPGELSVPSLHLRHSSFTIPSVALPTSQLILQAFRFFTYVTVHSPTLLSLLLRHKLFT